MSQMQLKSFLLWLAPTLLGILFFILLWSGVSTATDGKIPTPAVTWTAGVELFSDPFYDNGPNDKGIGWNIMYSLGRVGLGFGLAALVGIPLGFWIGRSLFASRAFNPIISL